jgi:thiamine pyrophosphate-dependent acetolactate synthase large subunit-like protein/rubredoxin
MAKYRCTICNYIYDEKKEGVSFSALPPEWRCPICGAPKDAFVLLTEVTIATKPITSTVSEILVEQMAEWGIKYVFGMPGTSSLGVVDAVRKNPRLKYLQIRHEQTAAFMASSYGKLTGNIAACLTIAGPGATNLATGLYDAKLDHSSVLAITGLVERGAMGFGSPQEIDQHSFFEPICVFNEILMSEGQTTKLITLAIKRAIVEKGVSHISIPNDVQKLPYTTKIIPFEGRMPNMAFSQSEFLVKKAASVIDRSERPVIIAGFGAMGSGRAVLDLAKRISAPVVTTFRAKGIVSEYEDLCVGCHGSIGSTAAARLVGKSDLLIVIGSSFSALTQIPEKKMVQIDSNPLMIAKEYPTEVGLLGNSVELIPKLGAFVSERYNQTYLDEIAGLKREWLEILKKEAGLFQTPLRPSHIIKAINDKISRDATIALDVGEQCWWFGRSFLMRDTQKLTFSANLGSMGSGLPGAMAAALAFPDRQNLCITGDGGFAMVMGDFMTAVKNNLSVKVFLFNNRQLGMIMQEQKIEGYPIWQTDLLNCDFARYAEGCGGVGIRVEAPNQLEDAVEEALASHKPVIVDIATDPRRII